MSDQYVPEKSGAAMRKLLYAIAPCLILPPLCFVVFSYPALKQEVENRLPLLSAHYLNRELAAEIAQADSRKQEGMPAAYGSILAEYERVLWNKEFAGLAPLSESGRTLGIADEMVAGFILWREDLPRDFMVSDPVKRFKDNLGLLRDQERLAASVRDEIALAHALDCLKYVPPDPVSSSRFPRGLPPGVEEKGLVFCGEHVPLERADVRKRIEYQIAYLLSDLRETTGIWLKRRDRYGEAMEGILEQEGLPKEFALLPALESGYSGAALSPSAAGGWWQFVRPTAVRSHSRAPDLDWTLSVNDFRDERRDLVVSTRSAARYLKWMRSRLGCKSWLTSAAAYNAGLTEINYRVAAYGTDVYWDMKLSLETEKYVPRWIALCLIDSNRKFYGLDVPPLSPVSFDAIEGVKLARDLPLSELATISESSIRFIREINGAIPREQQVFKATKNSRELTIHVPKGSKTPVLKALRSRAYLKNGT
jgi:membrane-bound lytic murein transglycosylase D